MSNAKKCRLFCFFASLFLLILGMSVYLFINGSETYIGKLIFAFFNIENDVAENKPILLFIRGYIPDLFWSAAFTFAVQGILALKGKKQFYLLLCSLLGIVFEILQLLGIVNGTFDTADIAVYFIGALFAIFIIKILWRKRNE